MKKSFIGALVGGIILFIWQFLSFALINLHEPAQQYTEKQDAILNFLNSQDLKEGGYFLPNVPKGTSMEESEKLMKEAQEKPWAIIQYHDKNDTNMVMNMIRGFLIDMVIVFLFIWILRRMNLPSFSTIVTAAIFTGLIVFFNTSYTGFIWYKLFDIWAFFLDAIVSWGLVGLWLAWWLRRGRTAG